jgi:hypothetical protein
MNSMKNKDDLLLQILQSPVNVISSQNLINRKEKDVKEDDDIVNQTGPYKVEITFGKAKEIDAKYEERVVKKAKEDPNQVIIDTPRGPMTLAEAIKAGFNLETGEFEDEMLPPDMQDYNMDPQMMEQMMMLMQQEGGQAMPPQAMAEGEPPVEEPPMEEMVEGEGGEEELLAQLMGEGGALI